LMAYCAVGVPRYLMRYTHLRAEDLVERLG